MLTTSVSRSPRPRRVGERTGRSSLTSDDQKSPDQHDPAASGYFATISDSTTKSST